MEEGRSSHMLRQIKEICEIVGIRTEEYAKVTKKWLDVKSLARDLNREKRYLGDRVFELYGREIREDIYEDITVKAIIGRIRNIEDTLVEYENEIDDIHDSAGTRTSGVRSRHHDDVAGDEDDWDATFTDSPDDEDDSAWDDADILATADSEDDPVVEEVAADETVYTDIPEDEIEEIESEPIEEEIPYDDESDEPEEDGSDSTPDSGAEKKDRR